LKERTFVLLLQINLSHLSSKNSNRVRKNSKCKRVQKKPYHPEPFRSSTQITARQSIKKQNPLDAEKLFGCFINWNSSAPSGVGLCSLGHLHVFCAWQGTCGGN
jgi:hypothetical protein